MRMTCAVIGLALLWSCSTDGISPEGNAYGFQKPVNFPAATYTFENNSITKDGFELGRALFYDPILSADSTIACANCHQQVRSFSDPVHRFSKGINDVSGIRNAPAIQNMAFQNHFFWDGGVHHLDFVPINAITNSIEMAEKLNHVVDKLNGSSFYADKFQHAFGIREVNSQMMLFALSQFMNMLISADSRYDYYIRNDGGSLSNDELQGLTLFRAKCGACHATDLFTDQSFRNNGIDQTFKQDSGRQRITEFSGDRGKFKVPSLRNAEVTFPYMHDGRFRTLEEVLNHYQQSVKDSETLDSILKQNGSLGISLTDDEKTKIIVFIKTLTDQNFMKDKRFSNPFKK
ncbi:MAG: cytochrome c peroxidase [Chryseolinea sp.]